VFRDADGNVDRFVADLSYNAGLLSVVNTDARPGGEREDLAEVDDYAEFTEDRVSA
jgi:hypothetical protein